MGEFYCEKCNYKTYRKDGYQKHMKSGRHLKMINGYDEEYKYECKFCSKKYIHSAGLSRHKRKCCPKNQESSKKYKDLENKYKDLENKYKDLENKYKDHKTQRVIQFFQVSNKIAENIESCIPQEYCALHDHIKEILIF
jgi:hypothetical protein